MARTDFLRFIDFRVIKSEKIDDRQLILVVLDIELNRALDELF